MTSRLLRRAPLDSAESAESVFRGVEPLDRCIDGAADALLEAQRPDGHWVFELEADATITAEYVLLQHFLGDGDAALERRVATYLRRRQVAQDGWSLFPGGPFNLSASVKAYLALKVIGDAPEAEHMRRARAAIIGHGGAGKTNVFTRVLLALFGIVPWTAVPTIPVEIMLLPRWSPFHIFRISYWSRTVLVPLMVLAALKPRARNPRNIDIPELFPDSRPRARRWTRTPHQSRPHFTLFAAIDAFLYVIEPWLPRKIRRNALDRAIAFVAERRNGLDGLGGIFPAMANTVMMYDALGYARDHPDFVNARNAIDRLLVVKADETYCQPCVSAVWDTVLACHALLEVGGSRAAAAAHKGLAWLNDRQVLDVVGDWAVLRPGVRPGGWPFQYANPHYPDLDDTAAVVIAMDRHARRHGVTESTEFRGAITRAREWVLGLQSANGGFGAFDADNTSEYLNHIPFADHGALLDPPTADVTARCAGMLAQLGDPADRGALKAALDFLRARQESNGSWYGRWGMNYIYGTWTALGALAVAGEDLQGPTIRRAGEWLLAIQNADGGWGESGDSYELDCRAHKPAPSTPSQTAWALLGLMAAGQTRHAAVERGIDYLVRTQDAAQAWREEEFTATGFPRVFYLRYHGYPKFFPLWALARYRNACRSAEGPPRFGM